MGEKKEFITLKRERKNKVKRVTDFSFFCNLCVSLCACISTKRLVRKPLTLLRPWDEFSDRGGRRIKHTKKIALKLSKRTGT